MGDGLLADPVPHPPQPVPTPASAQPPHQTPGPFGQRPRPPRWLSGAIVVAAVALAGGLGYLVDLRVQLSPTPVAAAADLGPADSLHALPAGASRQRVAAKEAFQVTTSG
ncbi:MAG TPA: hypothetical protein VE152_08465 [Acidimicrobiales bacterium]|nr:hypothetical protein [Acidimicrobiales bacterium]